MALFKIILFLGCIAFVAATKTDCMWTACENLLKTPSNYCQIYGYNHFTGEVDRRQCSGIRRKLMCCNLQPTRKSCKFTGCYEWHIRSEQVCFDEFGRNMEPYRTIRCSYFDQSKYKYECCPNLFEEN